MDSVSSEIVGDPNPSGCNHVITITGIQNLPDEILLQVFELLTHKEITQFSPVCRRWEVLARDPCLYRKLLFTENQPSTCMAVKIIKMAPQLVSLRMKGRTDADEILQHVGTNTSRLKVLRMFDCCGSQQCFDTSPNYLKNVFMYCTKIREIQLRNYWHQSETWRNIVKYCKDIEILSVTCIQDEDLAGIFKTFRHSLKILKLYWCIDIDESLLALASCSNMTTLMLCMAFNISKESLSAIGDMPNLMDLEINRSERMPKECWMRMFQKPMIKRLRRLALHYVREVDDDVLRLIMKNSKDLKSMVTSSYNRGSQLTLEEVLELTAHLV